VNAVLEKMIRVPKALLSRADILALQQDLTVKQRSFADEDKPVRVYTEGTSHIWLPRWYGHHFLWERGIEAVDRRSDGTPVKATCTAKLGHGKFPSQQPLFVDAVLRGVRDNGFGGFGVAPCGTGKTVMGVAVAAALGRSTLILVHKGFLMRQWKEALRLFMRVNGKPPKVGIVQQDTCQFGKDIPFAVGMIQSIASRDYPEAFYKAWGVVLVDETHHVPARTWLEVVGRLSARYTIGLTATLRRKDGLQPLFEHTLGPVLFGLKRDEVKADAVFFGIHFLGSTRYFYSAGGINRSRLEKRLANIESRNEVIVGEIIKAVEHGRKRIIVLAGTRIHLSRLYKLLPVALKRRAGFYVGGRKDEQLEKVEGRTVILATYGMAEEGLDIGDLDCIMLATPRPDVEQPVGRAFRFYVPKFKPLIVDFVDRIPGLVRWAVRREEQYKRLGVTLRNRVPASRY